jgi:hypothetical protein
MKKKQEVKKTVYSVVHTHQYGSDQYYIRCSKIPYDVEIAETCGIDFEPDKGEELLMTPIGGRVPIFEME